MRVQRKTEIHIYLQDQIKLYRGKIVGVWGDFCRWRYRMVYRDRGEFEQSQRWAKSRVVFDRSRQADNFEKQSCENSSERKHMLEDLAYKLEELYLFCREWVRITHFEHKRNRVRIVERLQEDSSGISALKRPAERSIRILLWFRKVTLNQEGWRQGDGRLGQITKTLRKENLNICQLVGCGME